MPGFVKKYYAISTQKFSGSLTLLIASDLHGCPYGKGQRELLTAMEAEHPAAILMPGDMNDDRADAVPFWDFIQGALQIAPCYFVTGNHDYGRHSHTGADYPGEYARLEKAKLKSLGVHVLEGTKEILPGTGGTVAVMGTDDVFVGRQEFDAQYLRCCRMTKKEQYTILVSHRPETAGAYRYYPGDLVVCGHAHGGQWRLPGARGGVYAPGQGLFPQYAGGLYRRQGGYLLVSCGLCYRYPAIPRFGNPPELTVLTIRGKATE